MLQATGFDCLNTKQFGFFIIVFVLLGSSMNFNIGFVAPPTYALDAIDAPQVQIDDGVVLHGAYLPVLDVNMKSEIIEYVVESGDTINGLAHKFQISSATLVVSNDIVGDIIRPGQTLKILPTSGILYAVKKSDTLSKISKNYNIPSKTIARFNDLSLDDSLAIGDEIIIPGVEPQIKKVSRNVVYTDTASYYTPANTYAATTGSGSFMKPTSGVYTQKSHAGHIAVDIAAPIGTPIYAAESGKVIRADISGWNGGYGSVIVVQHDNGYKTLYAHLSVQNVKVGDYVARGQKIAEMGNTGRSTGPHLHFEIMSGRQKLNPLKFF